MLILSIILISNGFTLLESSESLPSPSVSMSPRVDISVETPVCAYVREREKKKERG